MIFEAVVILCVLHHVDAVNFKYKDVGKDEKMTFNGLDLIDIPGNDDLAYEAKKITYSMCKCVNLTNSIFQKEISKVAFNIESQLQERFSEFISYLAGKQVKYYDTLDLYREANEWYYETKPYIHAYYAAQCMTFDKSPLRKIINKKFGCIYK